MKKIGTTEEFFTTTIFKTKEALDDMDSVLKINPANVNAINYKGVIFGEQGKH